MKKKVVYYLLDNHEQLFYLEIAFVQILFLSMKINDYVDWSWWVVMLPIFTVPILMLFVWVSVFFYILIRNRIKYRRNKKIVDSMRDINNDIEEFLKQRRN